MADVTLNPAATAGAAEPSSPAAASREATIYRMEGAFHVCPSGLKALRLLRQRGFAIDDRKLTTRAATDAFKAEHGVETTPQIWIGGERIGGYDDLRRHLGVAIPDPKATTYRPVIAIFGMAVALAAAVGWRAGAVHVVWLTLGFFTALLALQKLRDVEGFASGFLGYDLLARRWPGYAYAFPWLEALVGLLMIAGVGHAVMAPLALVMGGIGAWSVYRAVYIEKRALKCACVGGASNVPLGFVSLSENLAMIAMGVWGLTMVL